MNQQEMTVNNPKPGGKALIVFPATMLWCGQIAGRGMGNFLRIEAPASHRDTNACFGHAMEE